MKQDHDKRPLLAGVCGDPIAHSRSPHIFRHWFQAHGIDGHYVPLLIARESFHKVVPALAEAGFRGVNVTLPHKQMALEIADTVSETATQIGAANTLRFGQDGIHADNTDAFGFIENLRHACVAWSAARGPVVVFGAGGAARAAVFALKNSGAPEIRIANRTLSRAETLAAHFGKGVFGVSWADRSIALRDAALIVNTTSLGMAGQPALDLSLDDAPADALVHDIVYAPLETPLLADARARGMPTVDGLGMLLHQARPGFRAWFGMDPTVTPALRQACLAELR